MVQYETLILSVPEITNDETKQLEKLFGGMVQNSKGATISFDRWGKYKLAQPVCKNNYGVYFLARYEVPQDHKDELLKTLDEYFKLKLSNIIMRSMNTVLNSKTLEYTKPAPLDESTRDVDKFLKDNKMEGLISNSGKPEAEKTTEVKTAKEAAPVETAPAAEAKEAATEDSSTEEK